MRLCFRFPTSAFVVLAVFAASCQSHRLSIEQRTAWNKAHDLYREAGAAVEQAKDLGASAEQADLLAKSAELYRLAAVQFTKSRHGSNRAIGLEANLWAGKSFVGAEDPKSAIAAFESFLEHARSTHRRRPEALYWCARSYLTSTKQSDRHRAWRMLRELTWEHPESKWATFVRGEMEARLRSPSTLEETDGEKE